MSEITAQADRGVVPVRSLGGGLAALRIFSGVIWLSNGLAKAFFSPNANVDWGFISFNLLNRPAALSVLRHVSANTFQPLRWIYHDFVLVNWGFFQWFLTAAELAIGVSLLFGIASRLGATVALLLLGPIWIMSLPTDLYLREYP